MQTTILLTVPAGSRFSDMAGAYRDLIHAFRQLIRRPGHTFAIVMCLAVGLTVSIGILSVVTSLLYGDQPGIRDRRHLVQIQLRYEQDGRPLSTRTFSVDEFAILRGAAPALGSLAAEGKRAVAVNTKDGPIAVLGAFVTGNYFELLGTSAHSGRLLAPEDERPEAPPVAVVSEHFWRTRLEGASEAIGKPILLAGQSFTVVGVAPQGFGGLQPQIGGDEAHSLQVWIPLQHGSSWPAAPTLWLGRVVGRIRSGHTVDQARAHLAIPAARLAAQFPSTRANASFALSPYGFSPDMTPVDILLKMAAILSMPLMVFAIGCANVTNLQLARAAERARELAVRLSFGASRRQLIRLLTLETLFPAVAAVGTSIVLTRVILRYSEAFLTIQTSINWMVAAFSFALMMAVTFLTGLVPAWLVLRRPAALGLKQTARAGGLGLSRLRSVLVVGQVALSILLLCGAGFVMRLVRSMNIEVPAVLRSQTVAYFDPEQIGVAEVEASGFANELLARVTADARVVDASISRTADRMVGTSNGKRLAAEVTEMTPSWLYVMDLPVLTGRPLTSADNQNVGLISARLAASIAPGESPLGRILQIDDGPGIQRRIEIIGVVADNPTELSLQGAPPVPAVYVALSRNFAGPFILRIRRQSADSVAAVSADLRNVVRAVDARLPWVELKSGEEVYLGDAPGFRYLGLSVGTLGLLGLALAATGLYAFMSYVVLLRRREIGVRMAIGADPRQIMRMMVWQALRLVLSGGGIGLALAIPLAFGLRAIFVGRISVLDPAALLPPFALLLVAALLASGLPARRASTTDPINTLREE